MGRKWRYWLLTWAKSGDDFIVVGEDDCDALDDEEVDDGLGIEEEENLEDDFQTLQETRKLGMM